MSGSTATVELIRMGSIEERRSLNPRGHLNHEVIQEYVRRLENGETPPPIQVHRGKGVLFSGAHRYQAYKQFFEKRGLVWQDQKIPGIYRDDLPDPDEEPQLFRLMAAIANRDHGVRVSRPDRARVLVDLARARGAEIVRQYAAACNETPESLDELFRIFGISAEASADALRQAAEDGKARASTSEAKQEGEPERNKSGPDEESGTPPEPKLRDVTHPLRSALQRQGRSACAKALYSRRVVSGVRYRPEAFPTGHLKGTRPVVRVAVRRFREAVGPYLRDLTDAEREEIRNLIVWLEAALDAEQAA